MVIAAQFIVVDWRHLLLAGLSRRTVTVIPRDAPAAVVGLQIGGRGPKLGHFRFDRRGQKRPCAIPQNIGQPVRLPVRENSWATEQNCLCRSPRLWHILNARA